jgi:hypothetical protein
VARRQRLSEAQIAELFDPPTEQRELVRHFTLSAADLATIRRCRGDHNRLSHALMLRAHASNLFIPTTRLWAALKSRLLLGQAGFGSRNLPEISPKHRITDLYAWALALPRSPA